MNIIESAALTVRQTILEGFPPGPERERWLRWLKTNTTPSSSKGLNRFRGRGSRTFFGGRQNRPITKGSGHVL
jgi:hypothetical protein